MAENILDKLGTKFDSKDIRKYKHPNLGITLAYIPIDKIIQRANDVLGLNWEFHVVEEKVVEGTWLVRGRVTVHKNDGTRVEREQYGSKVITLIKKEIEEEVEVEVKIKKGKNKGQIQKKKKKIKVLKEIPADLGYDAKSALSDCIKKTFSLYGVALDLYSQDEANNDEVLPNEISQEHKKISEMQMNMIKKQTGKFRPEIADISDYLKKKYNVDSVEDISSGDARKEILELNQLAQQSKKDKK